MPVRFATGECRLMSDESYTIDSFIAAERMSRSALYLAWRRGRGPRYYNIDGRRRITAEARRDWHHQLEAEAMAGAK